MVLEINTKMNSMITKEEFQNNFEKLVTKSDTGLELSKLVSLLEVDDLSFTFRFGVDTSGLFLFDCIVIN
jgi:hypothetical protein